MPDASDLRPGAELQTKWDETVTVETIDADEFVCEIDGEFTETYTRKGVQNSLDDGVMEIVSTGSPDTGDNGERKTYESEPVSDTDPNTVPDQDLYIRFGNIPEDERSWDDRNQRQEAGVSVYACERDATDEDAPAGVDKAYYLAGTMLQTVFHLMARDTYLVTGEQVGTGADGEPLIRDVEVVAKLRTPKGVGGWTIATDE